MEESQLRSVHLVGVCGAGMKALAELLLDRVCAVAGSDLQPASAAVKKLTERGLVFHNGHSSANLDHTIEALVYSPAIPPHNCERMEAERRRIPQFTYSQMVGRLMRGSTAVCVAGTHGKSTTTAMVASILSDARRLSGVVIGAELCANGRSGWSGDGDLFVAESCEFQRSFLDFHPSYSAILNVEPDHFDCYADLDAVELAFREFADQTSDDGVLLVNGDCPVSPSISATSTTHARRVSFGLNSPADWSASNAAATAVGTTFQLLHSGRPCIPIDLNLHGTHNVTNALAAAALCAEMGIPVEIIRDSLAAFRGIRRRLEFVGAWGGATFVDDYAHHPTAVKATLETLRQIVGSRRVCCVFQPHQVQRTTVLMDEFSRSFSAADEVLLAPVFAARETVGEEPYLVSSELARRIESHGTCARALASLDQIVTTLDYSVRPEDVIVTMGAGDIDRIYHEFTRRIS